MRTTRFPGIKTTVVLCVLFAVTSILMTGCGGESNSESDPRLETLLDRIAIEDLLVRYYVDLTSGEGHDMAEYFTEDAMLDVNSMVSNGREEIEQLYNSVGDGQSEDTAEEVGQPVKMHMLLNNPIIKVTGDTATAWIIWTGVMNADIKERPYLQEQGREFTKLVKIDGKWFIKERYITADSSLPEMWADTYEPRSFLNEAK